MTLRGLALVLFVLLGGCSNDPAISVRDAAQPDARAMRNITSFSDALVCMDQLLRSSGRPRIVLSSSDIPDLTKQLSIGGDDMLINAISQMNRRSNAYVFLDQVRYKKDGNIDFMIAKDDRTREPRPHYYIRGSISQVDRGVQGSDFSLGAATSGGHRSSIGGSRRLSIVSVDMHLVHYASRQVVPGASVANSMIVAGQSWGVDTTGTINVAPFDLTLLISNVESEGQAARNLIELGAIELLGKHSGVRYSSCLESALSEAPETRGIQDIENSAPAPTRSPPPATISGAAPVPTRPDNTGKQGNAGTQRASAAAPPEDNAVRAARLGLGLLGYLTPSQSGTWDDASTAAMLQFQSDEGLLATGRADRDSMSRLKLRLMMRRTQAGTAVHKGTADVAG